MEAKTMHQVNIAAGLLLTLSLAGCASMGAAGAKSETRCPGACGVDISLPSWSRSPPSIPKRQEEIYVSRGAHMAITVRGGQADEAATKIVFDGDTPFVGADGKLISTIELKAPGTTFLVVRSDLIFSLPCEEPCKKSYRYKYNIVNHGNKMRPPRDPWIIIDQ